MLSGPSDLPDPAFHAYRKDLADAALAGDVVSFHYAEGVHRVLIAPATLRDGPSEDAEPLGELSAGQPFEMLDDSLGWAWGYAGDERRVGYVPSDALGRSAQH